MSELSLVIRNGRIADGTGGAIFSGDIGVSRDRIVAVGRVDGKGAREVDAGGNVVAPGFIDIHTHYDPQLCWDRLATPTPEHGVTSLIMGNCSVTLAPVRERDQHKIIQLFGAVEDMESRLLEDTVPFEWESFAEYLAYQRKGIGPNVGIFVGHAVLRLYVMGAASQERNATDAEITQMCDVLRDSIRAGAFGLSFTFVHFDDTGCPLACSFADHREKLALFNVLAEEGRGIVEVAPNLVGTAEDALASIDEFGQLALETGVSCTLSPLMQVTSQGDRWRGQLARYEEWRQKGAPMFAQTQVRPLDMTVQLARGAFYFSKTPLWRQVMEMPLVARIEALADPARRAGLNGEISHDLEQAIAAMVVKRVRSPQNKTYEGRALTEIAASDGKTRCDAMIDIALQDDLATEFSVNGITHADVDSVALLIDHPSLQIGSGDAGAHMQQFAGAGDTCYLFEKFVRAEGRMTVERAVQRLTSDIAKACHIVDRGEIAVGRFADFVIFDPVRISRGDEQWIEDVPGGSGRYVRHPVGIEKVIVNGEILVDRGSYTDARPGKIL